MNRDQIDGTWKQLTGKAIVKRGEITDDEWPQTKGRREATIGPVQERHGGIRTKAERQVDAWTPGL